MFKKILFAFSLCTLSLVADSFNEGPSSEMPGHENDERTALKQGTSGQALAPARFEINDGYNMFLGLEGLIWMPQADGLYYAQEGTSQSNNFNGKLLKVHPQWSPGFKAIFGGNMPYDGWDLVFSWTWFSSTASRTNLATNDSLMTLWSNPSTVTNPPLASYAWGKWNFGLNNLDVEMGRASWFGESLSIRPFIGVKTAWLDNSFTTNTTYATGPNQFSKIVVDSDFQGVGVRVGMDARFQLRGGWSIVALGSGSLLYGEFDGKFQQSLKDTPDGAFVLNAQSYDHFQSTVSNLQASLGIQWDVYFCDDSCHFGGKLAWEQNLWIGGNRLMHWKGSLNSGIVTPENSNISLQGGVASVHFDF